MRAQPSSAAPGRRRFTRRGFLQTAALAGLSVPAFRPAFAHATTPNSQLNHAAIGVGGMGWHDLNTLARHPRVRIAAVCDVDRLALDRTAQAFPDARRYADWRELLEAEAERVDTVSVSVPDHMHFPIAYRAIERGKHVYCQKPMCHDVAEVRALTRAAGERKVVTQLGTQMASGPGERSAVQLLREGAVGRIKQVYLSANRPGAVENYRLPGPRPDTGSPPPPELQWDWWLGTAPVRPYASQLYHPTGWRAWQDFGTGWSGDIGCHLFDAVWKGLNLQPPREVVAEVQASWKNSPARRADTWPQGQHITWTFPGNALTADKTLPVEWFDGDFYPPESIRALYSVKDYPPEAALFLGTEGALLLELGHAPILLPEDKFEHLPRSKPAPRDHYHHFVDACLGLTQTESHFAQTGPMTEAVLLGTVAVRVPDQKLIWDPVQARITNHSAANSFLRRTYREGWRTGIF